jgi:Ras-related protein Rab-5C
MERSFKVVILGCSAVGKSSIMKRLTDDLFNESEESTIGAAFYAKKYPDNVSLQIWDTAGQERYANLAPMYYRNSDAIVAVYDVTNKPSYFEALKWLKKTSSIPMNALHVLVGNKIDYSDEEREVTTALGRKGTKEQLGIADIFMETSAKSGVNVHLLFSEIAKQLSSRALDYNRSQHIMIQEPSSSTTCCSI